MTKNPKQVRIMMLRGPDQAVDVLEQLSRIIFQAAVGMKTIAQALEEGDVEKAKQVAILGAKAVRIDHDQVLEKCSVVIPPEMFEQAMKLKDSPEEISKLVKEFVAGHPELVERVSEVLMMQDMTAPPKERMH